MANNPNRITPDTHSDMDAPISNLPYLTADLPGIGGRLRCTEEDFQVEEIPAYQPEGAGDHVFAWIEKRGLTTPVAAERMARALGAPPRDVGWAGMKDRHAVTRQLLSFPPPCTPEAVQALDLPGITVLQAARHRHKLRTGHLRGNRFVLRVREVHGDADTAAARAQAILDRLARPPGSPNWFGAQRFGADGDNAAMGRALVQGTAKPGRRGGGGRQRRLYISALQSELFNEYLRRRMNDGLLGRVIDGDLLQKRESGGIFCATGQDAAQHAVETATAQARVDAGEVIPTGPMYGHRLMSPPAGSAAAAREDAVLAEAGLEFGAFARVGKLGTGTRRALTVDLGRVSVRAVGDRTVELSFSLPAGAYATAVLREVIKGLEPFPG